MRSTLLRQWSVGTSDGGDVSRKKKLIERQKEGKKLAKEKAKLYVGDVAIPQRAFVAVLSPNASKSKGGGGKKGR